ncbi:MAG: tetratricopeptide repeat protein [Bacteroidia bacterium]
MKTFLFLFCSFVFSASCWASNVDSLNQVWTDEAMPDSARFGAMDAYYIQYGFSMPDSALSLSLYHFDLAQRKNSQAEMAVALNEKAIAMYVLGEVEPALVEFKRALDITISTKDSTGIARSYANIGSIYRDQSRYQEAIRYYFKGLSILEAKNEYLGQADVVNNLGLIYEDIKMNDLALDYFKKALKLYEKLDLQDKTGNIWLNMGAVYEGEGNLAVALPYYHKAAKILKAHNHRFSLADCYQVLAQVYQKLSKSDSALYYIQESQRINNTLGNEGKIISNLIVKGDLILESSLEEATRLGEKALIFAKGTDADNRLKVAAYKLLYKCYKQQGNYKKSLAMHERYLVHYDSVLIEENKIAVVREAIQSEFDSKLYNSQLEDEKKRTVLKLAQLNRIYAIVLIGLILFAAILFYIRQQKSTYKKQEALLLDEIEKLKITGSQSIPIHTNTFQLDRTKIEATLNKKLNETDWKVLNILLSDPVISNKDIAEKAFLTVDGIGSSLRRMYVAFDIKESKYKKISLLMESMKMSNSVA